MPIQLPEFPIPVLSYFTVVGNNPDTIRCNFCGTTLNKRIGTERIESHLTSNHSDKLDDPPYIEYAKGMIREAQDMIQKLSVNGLSVTAINDKLDMAILTMVRTRVCKKSQAGPWCKPVSEVKDDKSG